MTSWLNPYITYVQVIIMNDQIQQFYDLLKLKGLKLTPARKIMLKIFLTGENKFLDAVQVYDQVKRTDSRINFSTVYRNLETLVQNAVVEKITLEGKAAYTLFEKQRHRHHMICTSCRKTTPLPYCPVKELENILKREDNGFLPIEHKVEIYGYCKDCRVRE